MLKFKVLSITIQRLLFFKSEQALAPQEKNNSGVSRLPARVPPTPSPPPTTAGSWPQFGGALGRARGRLLLQPPEGSPTQPPGPAPTRFAGPWLPGAGPAGKPLRGGRALDSELGAHRLHPRGDGPREPASCANIHTPLDAPPG